MVVFVLESQPSTIFTITVWALGCLVVARRREGPVTRGMLRSRHPNWDSRARAIWVPAWLEHRNSNPRLHPGHPSHLLSSCNHHAALLVLVDSRMESTCLSGQTRLAPVVAHQPWTLASPSASAPRSATSAAGLLRAIPSPNSVAPLDTQSC